MVSYPKNLISSLRLEPFLGLAHQQVSEVVRIAEIPNRVGDPRRINH